MNKAKRLKRAKQKKQALVYKKAYHKTERNVIFKKTNPNTGRIDAVRAKVSDATIKKIKEERKQMMDKKPEKKTKNKLFSFFGREK